MTGLIVWSVILFLVYIFNVTCFKQYLISLLWIALPVMTFITFGYQIFVVPSSSMAPNLVVGDYVVVSKYAYGYNKHSLPVGLFSKIFFLDTLLGFWEQKLPYVQPRYGDVVVFKTPVDSNTYYVKRVVGLPGDSVQMINGDLHINGMKLQKHALKEKIYIEMASDNRQYLVKELGNYSYDNTQKFIVPENHFFFVGDNRDNSLDSRGVIGMIPGTHLVGRVDYYAWSVYKNVSFLLNPIRWLQSVSFTKLFRPINA